jgi:hypothetical protein
MFGCTCGSAACFLLHAGHGLRPAPGIPCALSSFDEGTLQTNSGITCRETAIACLFISSRNKRRVPMCEQASYWRQAPAEIEADYAIAKRFWARMDAASSRTNGGMER